MIARDEERFIRRPDVRELAGERDTSLEEAIANGLMPPAIRIGPRRVAWPLSEIRAVVAARIAGLNDDEMKALVARLVAKRADAWREIEGTL